MRLQTKLTIAICSSLALAALTALGGIWIFADLMVKESLGKQVANVSEEAVSSLNSEALRALSLAKVIAAIPEITEAMDKQQRERLATVAMPLFQALKAEGADQLQFHLPPAISFFRAHQPAKFGDDLSSFRHMVVETNETSKPVFGLEKGVAGVGIRGVTPIFRNGKRIGSVEVGLTVGKMFVDGFTKQTGAKIEILLDSAGGLKKLASTLPADFSLQPDDLDTANTKPILVPRVKLDGEPWAVSARPLNDYSGKTIGVILVAIDRSALDQIWSNALIGGAVGALLILLLGIAVAWWLQHDIGLPLAAMTHSMDALVSGQTDVTIEPRSKIDEIVAMSHALRVFRDNNLEKQRLELETVEQRSLAQAEHEQHEAMQRNNAAEQASVVSRLAEALSHLAEGDLTCHLPQAFPPSYEKLRVDFNSAVNKLRDTLQGVAQNVETIRSGAGEISRAANDLARRTEQQAASLEETAATLEEITTAICKTADGAHHASDIVGIAHSEATKSGEIVSAAVGAMTEIEDSARKISQIIGVIDEIAFQTNLLALNAGVEAARAGETGRGFAVVASEVRALAQRSAEAAKEIKALISTSSAQVEHGVSLVDQTGTALSHIIGHVKQIADVITGIAASSNEQSSSLQQVNVAVSQMDQVTQQNAAMVEQSTAASQTLAEEAQHLAKAVAYFKTIESESPSPQRKRLRNVA